MAPALKHTKGLLSDMGSSVSSIKDQSQGFSLPAALLPSAALLRFISVTGLLLVALFCIFILGIQTGDYDLSTEQILEVLFLGEDEVTHATRIPRLVVHELRLPRMLLGVMVGSAMAVSGVMLQDTMRNPLAEPGLLGVSNGAVLVVAVVTVFGISIPPNSLPMLAMLGGLASGTVLLFASTFRMDTVRLILIGAAMTAFFNSMVIVVISLGKPFDVQVLYRYMVGSLSNRTWDEVNLMLPWFIIGMPIALLTARALNLLQLGDEVAEGLGLPVTWARFIIFAISIALVSSAVAVAGPISFVALASPHIARRILNTTDAKRVLPVSALIGAVLLCGADLAVRRYFPVELPVGIFTIVIGAPVLLLLLRQEIGRIH